MNEWTVILNAGIEGGSITLCGQYNGKGWIFKKDIADQTPMLIDEPASYSCSEQMYSWEEALEVLDSHPWHLFYPLEVHPVFRGAVLAAVVRRTQPDMIAKDYGFRHWLQVCSELPHVEWKLALGSL
ncbi:MAG: hypothetical protein JWM30_2157 [Burkholderia sp.]|jgi:hypothetical protein|nr:hypothetical protein [Burkholderia sp.]